jgi:hypothetical protein
MLPRTAYAVASFLGDDPKILEVADFDLTLG